MNTLLNSIKNLVNEKNTGFCSVKKNLLRKIILKISQDAIL